MNFVNLGNTGLKFSQVILGCGNFGGGSVRAGHHRLRHGGCLRRWSQCSATRDILSINSKVFNPVAPGPNHRGLSRLHIIRQVDASLQRLAVDYLDMYLMHEPDPSTPME